MSITHCLVCGANITIPNLEPCIFYSRRVDGVGCSPICSTCAIPNIPTTYKRCVECSKTTIKTIVLPHSLGTAYSCGSTTCEENITRSLALSNNDNSLRDLIVDGVRTAFSQMNACPSCLKHINIKTASRGYFHAVSTPEDDGITSKLTMLSLNCKDCPICAPPRDSACWCVGCSKKSTQHLVLQRRIPITLHVCTKPSCIIRGGRLLDCVIDTHRRCASCSAMSISPKRCGGCKAVYYCSKNCQQLDWQQHKATCHSSISQ